MSHRLHEIRAEIEMFAAREIEHGYEDADQTGELLERIYRLAGGNPERLATIASQQTLPLT